MTKISEAGAAKFRRFYTTVRLERTDGDYAILLDGDPAKTRHGLPLTARSEKLAEAIADEWRGDTEFVAMEALPLTRLAMTSIDCGDSDRAEWTKTIINFLRSDLLCYGAESPQALVDRQLQVWTPFIEWARDGLGLDLKQTAGIAFIEQPPETIDAAIAMLAGATVEKLLSLRIITELTGSAVLAFAVGNNAFATDKIFAASRVDEHFQRERWGEDEEASAREAMIRRDFDAACRMLDLAGA